MDVVVITPSTGAASLQRAMDSVAAQSYRRLEHHIVFDGEHFGFKKSRFQWGRQKFVALPHNTGGNGYNGHRIYAGYGLMVNADVVMYLDEDCCYRPEHVASLVQTLSEHRLDWCYSLRQIINEQGETLLEDNCESLGMWQPWDAAQSGQQALVDTNCYALKRHTLASVAEVWMSPEKWGADRKVYAHLHQQFPRYGCSGLHSSQYGLGGRHCGATVDYFRQGNAQMQQRFSESLPWRGRVCVNQIAS